MALNISKTCFLLQKTRKMALVSCKVYKHKHHTFISLRFMAQHLKNLISVTENKEDGAGVMQGVQTQTP